MLDSSTASTFQFSDILTPQYTQSQIAEFNKQLEGAEPQTILRWAIDNLDGLYQTTAFGLYVASPSHILPKPDEYPELAQQLST